MHIPKWLNSLFERENFSCPQCKAAFNVKGVSIIGIKGELGILASDTLYVEYNCSKCKQKVGYEIMPLSLEELSVAILDELQTILEPQKTDPVVQKAKNRLKPNQDTNDIPKAKSLKSKSKITLEETKTAIEMMNKSANWIEWLSKIGANLNDTTEENKAKQKFKIQDSDHK